MKKFFEQFRGAALAAAVALVAMLPSEGALAQVVTQLPTFVSPNPGVVTDLGNGPMEMRVALGNAIVTTSQGSGIATADAGTTTLTLQASAAATPPCVGCIISGAGITSGTTVAAFNGTTGITLSASMTIANGAPVAWGMACSPVPPVASVLPLQAGVTPDLPLYTQARVCAYAQNSAGAQVLVFPIGAH
jgi:hypothetical protein